jgi:hypothetical protein
MNASEGVGFLEESQMKKWILLPILLFVAGVVTASNGGATTAPGAGRFDAEAIFSKTNPNALEIQAALDLAGERMAAPNFKQYEGRFKGISVDWSGVVYNTVEHEGKLWVLVCTSCPNGLLTNFDILFVFPAKGGTGFERGREIGFRGRIDEVVGNPELAQMIGTGSIGYKVVLTGVELR